MNLIDKEAKIITTLLTYPQQAAKILSVRSDSINRESIDNLERVSYQMKTNGSQEAAAFLLNLALCLNRLIDTTDINSLKPEEIEALISSMTNVGQIQQLEIEAHRHLINALLTYPHQTTKLLTSHQHLINQNLVEMIKKLAIFMAANGSGEAAVFLVNLAMRLTTTTANLEVHERKENHPKAIARVTPKNKFKLFSGIALITLLLLFIINQFSGNKLLNSPPALVINPANKLGNANTTPVETVSLKPVKKYQVSRSYSGRVVAKRNVDLSFPLSGMLTKIKVEEGEVVKKDTPLAYLNTDTLHVKQQELLAKKARLVAQLKELEAGARPETIAAARAVVADVREQLKLATQKRLRRIYLYEQGAISREQSEEAVASESSLQARLNEAQSRLDELEAGTRSEQIEAQQASVKEINANIAKIVLELNKSVLKAPFAGTISKVQVDEGTIVSPERSVLRLVEDGVLEAHIGIPVDRSEQIEVGNTLALKIEENIYQAKVASLLPELDANTRTLTAVLTLKPSPTQKVFPGQTAQLQLTKTIADSGFWLPITALVRGERGLWYCYVVSKTDSESTFRIERRAVEVLHGDSNRVLVRGTLRPGEKAIANDIDRLVPGQLVTLKN